MVGKREFEGFVYKQSSEEAVVGFGDKIKGSCMEGWVRDFVKRPFKYLFIIFSQYFLI